jgi:glucan phosphorylase
MREEAGAENFFLFGLTEDEVERVKRDGYRPSDYVNGNGELAAVLDLIAGGTFSHGDTDVFRPLVDNLRFDDPFLVVADYASYIECQDRVSAAWQDTSAWTRMSILNTAQRQVLVGPGHRGVLRRHLERRAGDRQRQRLVTAERSIPLENSAKSEAVRNVRGTRSRAGCISGSNPRSAPQACRPR